MIFIVDRATRPTLRSTPVDDGGYSSFSPFGVQSTDRGSQRDHWKKPAELMANRVSATRCEKTNSRLKRSLANSGPHLPQETIEKCNLSVNRSTLAHCSRTHTFSNTGFFATLFRVSKVCDRRHIEIELVHRQLQVLGAECPPGYATSDESKLTRTHHQSTSCSRNN